MNQRISLQQFFLYLTIVSAFMGMLVGTVSVGSIHLFPYRFLLVFMCLLFVAGTFVNHWRLNLSNVKVKLYLQFFVLWLAYAFLSMTWAADKSDALRNCIFLFMGFSIIFFLVYYFSELDQLKRLYWLWILIFVALIPVGIWEVHTGNHLYISKLFEEDRARYLFAPTTIFNNQNDYAAYIAMTLPMIIAWMRYSLKLTGRVLGVLVFIMGLWLLIETTSRSCYLAVFSGILFWFLFLLGWKDKIKTLALIVFVGALIVAAFPVQSLDTFEKMEKQVNSLVPTAEYNDDIGSIDVRKNLIKNVFYFTFKSAGFGVGAGNAEYYMENFKIYPVNHVINVHNWGMEILVNYGVFIFAGYLILYTSLLMNIWRVYKKVKSRNERMICEALLVGWVSFFMASVSSSSMIAFRPQWLYLGFILAFLNYSRIKESRSNASMLTFKL